MILVIKFEPRREKTGFRDFRPGQNNNVRPLRSQKMVRSLKFRIYEKEKLYYPSGENKGADHLCSYAQVKIRFSHDEAHLSSTFIKAPERFKDSDSLILLPSLTLVNQIVSFLDI